MNAEIEEVKAGGRPRDAEASPAVHLVQSITSGSRSTGGFERINRSPLHRETCCMSSPPIFRQTCSQPPYIQHLPVPNGVAEIPAVVLVSRRSLFLFALDHANGCGVTHYADVAAMVHVELQCTVSFMLW